MVDLISPTVRVFPAKQAPLFSVKTVKLSFSHFPHLPVSIFSSRTQTVAGKRRTMEPQTLISNLVFIGSPALPLSNPSQTSTVVSFPAGFVEYVDANGLLGICYGLQLIVQKLGGEFRVGEKWKKKIERWDRGFGYGIQYQPELPVLDISQPIHPSSLFSLSQACQEWGFFLIINHGVSKDLYHKLSLFSRQLFSFPLGSKLNLGPSSSLKTYTPHYIASPFYESIRVHGPDFSDSAKSSANVLFSESSFEFSDIVQEYGSKMTELSKRITEIALMSLGDGFARKYHESEFNNCQGYMRIINYSPPESVEDEEVEGLGMHTDMSCITIVYQDDIGGLQVRSKEGEWMDIRPCEGTLVVNIGDLLQAWSNGRLRSSEHRVMLKRCVNRLSLAFFWCFEDEKVILAPDEVVGEGKLRLYTPFVCLDYLKFRASSEKGKFEKVGLTIKDFAGTGLQI